MDIVLVDDDAYLLKILSRGLVERGHEVRTAANGVLARQQLEAGVPNLVISDVRMPEMDGIELLEYLRTHYPGVPCVLMTGFEDGSAIAAVQHGAYDFLQKPVKFPKLLECVERVQARLELESQVMEQALAVEGLRSPGARSVPPEGPEDLASAVAEIRRCSQSLEAVWTEIAPRMGVDLAGHRIGSDEVRDLFAAITRNLARLTAVIERYRVDATELPDSAVKDNC